MMARHKCAPLGLRAALLLLLLALLLLSSCSAQPGAGGGGGGTGSSDGNDDSDSDPFPRPRSRVVAYANVPIGGTCELAPQPLLSAGDGLSPIYSPPRTSATTTQPSASVAIDARFSGGGALVCGSKGRVELFPGVAPGDYGTVSFWLRGVDGPGTFHFTGAESDNKTAIVVYAFRHGDGSDNGNNSIAIGLVPRSGTNASSDNAPLSLRAVVRRGERTIVLDSDGPANEANTRAPLALRDGEWRMVALSMAEDATGPSGALMVRYTLYVDGERRALVSAPMGSSLSAGRDGTASSPTITVCGADPDASSPSPPSFQGPQHLALYSRALDGGEVSALYNAWLRQRVSQAAGTAGLAVAADESEDDGGSSSGGVPIFSPRGASYDSQPLPPAPPGALRAASGHACLLPSTVASSSSVAVHYGCIALPADLRPLDAPLEARAFCVTAEALALGGDGQGWEPCAQQQEEGRRSRRGLLQQASRARPSPSSPVSPPPPSLSPLLVPLAPGQAPPRLTVGGRACLGGCTLGALFPRCAVEAQGEEEGQQPPSGDCAPLLHVPAAGSTCAWAARALDLDEGGPDGGGGLSFERCVAQLGVVFCAEAGEGEQWWQCPPPPQRTGAPGPTATATAAGPRLALSSQGKPLALLACRGPCVLNAPVGRFQCRVAEEEDNNKDDSSQRATCFPALRSAFAAPAPLLAAANATAPGSSPDNQPAVRPCAVPFYWRGSLRDDCVPLGGGLQGCPVLPPSSSSSSSSSSQRPWGLCAPRPAAIASSGTLLSSMHMLAAAAAAALSSAPVHYTSWASACALPFLAANASSSKPLLMFGCVTGSGGDGPGTCPSAAHGGVFLPCAPATPSLPSPPPSPPLPRLFTTTLPAREPCAVPYARGRGSGAPAGSGAELGAPSLVWDGQCVRPNSNGDAGWCRIASGAWRRCVAEGRRGARTGRPCLFPFPWYGLPEPGATDCVRLGASGDGTGHCHVGGGEFEPCAFAAGAPSPPPPPAWLNEVTPPYDYGPFGGGGGGGTNPALLIGLLLGLSLPPAALAIGTGLGVAMRRAAAGLPPRRAPAPAAPAAPTSTPPPLPSEHPSHAPRAGEHPVQRVALELAAARERLFSSRPGVREMVVTAADATTPSSVLSPLSCASSPSQGV